MNTILMSLIMMTMTNGVSRVVLDTQSAQYQTAGD